MGRDWGSPEIPERIDLKTMIRMAPQVARRPRWATQFALPGRIPDLTAPNLAPPGGEAPTFFGAYYEWMTTPPPSWDEVAWMRQQWGGLGGGVGWRGGAVALRGAPAPAPRRGGGLGGGVGARSRCPTTVATTS